MIILITLRIVKSNNDDSNRINFLRKLKIWGKQMQVGLIIDSLASEYWQSCVCTNKMNKKKDAVDSVCAQRVNKIKSSFRDNILVLFDKFTTS